MSTISFSVDEKTKQDFVRWAKRAKKSQSELFRELLAESKFNEYFRAVHQNMEPVFEELDLKTEEDIYEYLAGSEIYQERKQKIAQAKTQR